MSELAKFFISSVAEDGLTAIRNHSFETLKELGHAPEMYEKTFGPWSSESDGVTHCLKKVADSDAYCLFIANHGGTKLQNGQSVTHLEFIEAIRQKKVLLIFTEQSVKDRYFREIRWIIKEYIESFKVHHQHRPKIPDIHQYLKLEANNPKSKIPPSNIVDPYIWAFLYDIVDVKQKYVEDLHLGVPIEWKRYTSDLLKQGLRLIPSRQEFQESIALASAFGDFSVLAIESLSHLAITEIDDMAKFLEIFRISLAGAEIVEDYTYTKNPVGELKECSAISVFYRDGNSLRNKGATGDTNGNKEFSLYNSSSFAALTYNESKSENPMLFYIESKRMFYLTFKINEYVLSYHFPEKTKWNQQMFIDYRTEIIDGILNQHANSFIFKYLNAIVWGLQK